MTQNEHGKYVSPDESDGCEDRVQMDSGKDWNLDKQLNESSASPTGSETSAASDNVFCSEMEPLADNNFSFDISDNDLSVLEEPLFLEEEL